jgi:hypothetical protein
MDIQEAAAGAGLEQLIPAELRDNPLTTVIGAAVLWAWYNRSNIVRYVSRARAAASPLPSPVPSGRSSSARGKW